MWVGRRSDWTFLFSLIWPFPTSFWVVVFVENLFYLKCFFSLPVSLSLCLCLFSLSLSDEVGAHRHFVYFPASLVSAWIFARHCQVDGFIFCCHRCGCCKGKKEPFQYLCALRISLSQSTKVLFNMCLLICVHTHIVAVCILLL